MRVKQFFITIVFGFFSAWFGSLAIPFILLLSCNLIDYATGIMAAHNRGQGISSKTGIKGIFKKVGQWLAVLVAYLMDIAIATGAGYMGWVLPLSCLIATLTCFWLVFNEIISIIENIGDIGTNVPPFILTIAKKLKADTEEKGNTIPTESDKK